MISLYCPAYYLLFKFGPLFGLCTAQHIRRDALHPLQSGAYLARLQGRRNNQRHLPSGPAVMDASYGFTLSSWVPLLHPCYTTLALGSPLIRLTCPTKAKLRGNLRGDKEGRSLGTHDMRVLAQAARQPCTRFSATRFEALHGSAL